MCKEAMRRAIEIAVEKKGSRQTVAEALGITRQAMQQWDTADGKYRVPPRHVLGLERMSGVSRYELRPDIYGAPPSKPKHPKRRADARVAA